MFMIATGLNTSYAQETIDNLANDSARLFVEYMEYKGYVNDSTFISKHHSFLYLGQKASISIYQKQTPDEYIKTLETKIGASGSAVNKNDLIESFKKQIDIEKMVSLVYAKYYNSPAFLELKALDKKSFWISDTAVFKWILANEFRTIQGYRCQRADRINSKGENTTAWFTEEIPISAGPLFMSGLPGLILEFANSNQKYLTKAIVISSTDIPPQRFRKWLTGTIMSKSQYKKLYAGESKKIQQFKSMMDVQKNSNQ